MALREVGVQPNFYSSIAVDTDKILLWMEIAHEMEQLFEAIKGPEQYIQIFRIWDILNIAQSDRHMFDVYPSIVISVAKLSRFLSVNEFGVNYSVFTLPPLEKLQILFVFCFVVEIDLVLFYFLAGEVVAIEIGESMFRTVAGAMRRNEVPVFALERGRLIRL